MRHCNAAGCSRQAAGRSRFCSKHFTANRRHGHPAQSGITCERLRPHVELLRSYIARHGGPAAWAKLEAVVASATRDALGVAAEAQAGKPFHRWGGLAAGEFIRVAQTAHPRRIIETVAAMRMLQECEPRAFQSDKAVWVQTSRRFRCLSSATKRTYWGVADGKRKTVTRDLRSDVAVMLGRMLHEALGDVGRRVLAGNEAEHGQRAATYQAAYAMLQPGTAAA